jgi:hypothetical protein
MNRTEALEAAISGKKITHRYFLDYEYLEFKDGKLITEDGYEYEERFHKFDYFESDWSIFKEFNLEYCPECIQMTNHLDGVCQKHNKE